MGEFESQLIREQKLSNTLIVIPKKYHPNAERVEVLIQNADQVVTSSMSNLALLNIATAQEFTFLVFQNLHRY